MTRSLIVTASALAIAAASLAYALTQHPAAEGPLTLAARPLDAAVAAQSPADWVAQEPALQEALWQARGFHIARAVFVAAPAAGFGIFDPRNSAQFKPGEPILIYAEPRGYGYGAKGEGVEEIAFDIDLQVLDSAGKLLADKPGLLRLGFLTRAHNREFMANLRYDLAGLGPGDYRLRTTFRDVHGRGQASVTSEITIATP